MRDQPVRRTVTVLLVYVAVGWVVLVVGGWLRQVLVLPDVFMELLRWGLGLGVAVAAVMAWYYPAIAANSESDSSAPDRGGR